MPLRSSKRAPSIYVSKETRAQRTRDTFQTIRDTMPTATIAVCFALHLSPTGDNRRKARGTIYKWTRARHREWKESESLLESLSQVTQSACVLGLPVCIWESAVSGRWPAIRFPSHNDPRKQKATIDQWNRLSLQQADKLWSWYESSNVA